MGMDQTVTFSGKPIPSWSAVRDLLGAKGFALQMRMIDGQLAFLGEEPPDLWSELRVGTPHGMVTVRHGEGQVTLVTWGNADLAMRQAWNALTWAFAEAGGGQVLTPGGALSPTVFRQQAEMPVELG